MLRLCQYPRKGANASITKGKKKAKGKQPEFPFMKLLPELRREIYSLVLPQQDSQSRSSGWLTMDETPNDFMNLLLVNKQVSEEARSVLYGVNTFTMVISEEQTLLLGSFTKNDFLPLPTKPSLPFIKNWQIALWPGHYFLWDGSDLLGARHRDAVLSACSEIAKSPELQRLKLSIPCLCNRSTFRMCQCSEPDGDECYCLNEEDIGDLHDVILNGLIPFNQLRFKGKVELVATPEPAEQLWSDKHYGNPTRLPDVENAKGYTLLSKYSHHQCPEPRCVSFAASFGPVMATLMGDTTPDRLTDSQLAWLALKKRVAETMYQHTRNIPNIDLGDLWSALDSRESMYFEKEMRIMDKKMQHYPYHIYHGR
ncbi:MAG: hypothetical protein LQ339_007085 [Xanthoria mediterranea]|nr:MAG: hypothetical protein LQ339_007085 [Xanthoria mediterranea]